MAHLPHMPNKSAILLIEDDAGQRQTLADILTSEGLQPFCCETVQEALTVCAEQDVPVAILDLRLADMDGLQLLHELHQHRPHLKVIIHTGHASLASAIAAINQGAFAYVEKMGNVEELLAHVHRAFHVHLAGYSEALGHEVQQRTQDLIRANAELKREIAEHQQAEEARQRLEGQLRQIQKMDAIGTLAGGIAHEFNNILAVIIGYTEMAAYDTPRANPVYQSLQEVLIASNRAKDLAQQILTFSREQEQEQRPVQLALLVQETLKLLRASLPTTIEIRQQITPEVGPILADATQMHQILMNLCTNAEHAMREIGGVIAISVDQVDVEDAFVAAHQGLQPGPYVRLTVRDTGHGMVPHIAERVFEPFFTTKGVGEGTGMGLAIVHGIVTNHRGAITVQSTLGEGTVVTIYLPQIDSTVDVATPAETSVPGGHGCILLIDDEESLGRLGQAMLQRLGYEAVVRTSSLEALQTFCEAPHRFDLVITDQTMPKMTGEQLAAALRQIRPDIPIILCTGFSHIMHDERAQASGINAFLMKPLTMQDLALAIQRVLEAV